MVIVGLHHRPENRIAVVLGQVVRSTRRRVSSNSVMSISMVETFVGMMIPATADDEHHHDVHFTRAQNNAKSQKV